MKRLKQYGNILACSILFFTACTEGEFVTSETGLEYAKVRTGTGEKPNDGDFLMLNVAYYDANENLMFSSLDRGQALPLNYVDSVFKNNGSLEESFRLCGKGDSLVLKIPAGTIFKESFKRNLPDTLTAESIITVYMGVEDVFTPEEFQTYRTEQAQLAQAKAAENAKEQISIDAKIIEDYLSENGIEAIKTEEGLFYVITEKGNGEYPTRGSMANVKYAGTLLDGTEFDAGTYEFALGTGQVIQGWHVGIALLSKGAKATLYLPSSLAYGARGSGPVIGPNSVLKFDVELLDFK